MSGSFQSHNYVPGVSGWKVDNKGVLVLNDGNQRVIAKMLMVTTAGPGQTNDQAAQAVRDAVCDERKLDGPKTAPPFIVVDGITYISEAEVERGSIAKAKISDNRSVKMEWCNGRYVVAGTGIGFAYSDASASAETYLSTRITSLGPHIASQGQAITALNNPYASKINETELGKDLASEINKFPDLVRETIRKELRPGGLLHRSR